MNNHITNSHDSLSVDKAQSLLEDIGERGLNEGGRGVHVDHDDGGISQAVRIILNDTRATLRSQLNTLSETARKLTEKLSDLKNRNLKLEQEVLTLRPQVKLATGIFYTVAGLIFILGDIEFSRQTIIQLWGLGMDTVFGQVSLILSIGLATFIVKLFYERFIEVRFVEGSKEQDGVVKAFFIVLVPLTIFAFLQIAYVRGETFEIMNTKLYEVENIYTYIFDSHPRMNMVSFIGIAFMFIMGGAVLLTVGMNQVREYYLFYNTRKRSDQSVSDYKATESDLNSNLSELNEVKEQLANLNDDALFEKEVENKSNFYKNIYIREHRTGLKKFELDKEATKRELFAGDSFHQRVRSDLDLNSLINGQKRR